MYCLSKDYKKLYTLVKDGENVACFVDYVYAKSLPPVRDICLAKKNQNNIMFIARGISYGNIDYWEPQTYDYFEKVCKGMNLEWIES